MKKEDVLERLSDDQRLILIDDGYDVTVVGMYGTSKVSTSETLDETLRRCGCEELPDTDDGPDYKTEDGFEFYYTDCIDLGKEDFLDLLKTRNWE